MKHDEYKPCSQMPGCRARENGLCTALTDTKFRSGICPFYKTVERCRKDNNDNYDRLLRIGRDDLIKKYHLRRYPDVCKQV